MDYFIWVKRDYEEAYELHQAGDLEAARRVLDELVRAGADPVLTVEVAYNLNIKISEVPGEIKESKAKRDTSAGAPGNGEVRRSDSSVTAKLDKGNRDNSADNLPGN